MPSLRARVRLATPGLLLALATCTPRVPATLELDDSPAASAPARPKPGAEAEFDVERTLAAAERALLAIDALRGSGRNSEFDYDAAHTWLPDVGLRSLYYFADQLGLSLAVVGELFGAPAFNDGPHGEQPDLAASSYGAYNPAFVERVGATARALGKDRARVERTRAAFERQLRGQAQTYRWVYMAIHHDPRWYEGYKQTHIGHLRQIAAGEGPDWSASPYDRDTSGLIDQFADHGLVFYETATAIDFWVRRDLDGTAALWLDALDALLAAYGHDPEAAPPAVIHG